MRLTPEHAAHLAFYRIPIELSDTARVRSVSDLEARELLGLNGFATNLSGIYFPYHHPVTGRRTGARVRLDHPDEMKYLMEPGCRHLFFAPGSARYLREYEVPVVVVEAEKSALALAALSERSKHPMLIVATGGCSGWKRKSGNRPLPEGGSEPTTGPSPDLDLIDWTKRRVIIVFDSNSTTNPQVSAAQIQLANELSRRGAAALVAKLPPREGVNGPDDLIATCGDDAMLRELLQPDESQSLSVNDMPEGVLQGRLGKICKGALRRSPIAYAWPSIVTAAGTRAHQGSTLRTNLFCALVGPVDTGKSDTIKNAIACAGFALDDDEVETAMAGSAEGLLKKIGDTGGCARLYFPDELAHLLSKAQIQHSSYATVLQRAYYETKFEMCIANSQRFLFNASLSIVGGIVEEKFEELFGSATTAGLYDRFIFGVCPRPFLYDYRPFDLSTVLPPPVRVEVAPEVFDMRFEWAKTIPGMTGRIADHCLRVAAICAGFDGKTLLRARDLGPALELGKYQIRVRAKLYPNPGQNPEAVCANAILSFLGTLAPGQWVGKRLIGRAIHAERFGPSIFKRAGEHLIFNEELESTPDLADRRKELWRLLR